MELLETLGPWGILYSLLAGAFLVLIIDIMRVSEKKNRAMKDIPVFSAYMLLKTICQSLIYNHQKMFKIAEEYRVDKFKTYRALRANVGYRTVIALADPRDVEIILSSSEHLDKSPEYQNFNPWLGEGLLISHGDKWRTHRKLIAPTFHFNVLKSFFSHFNENSRDTIDKMESFKGKEFDVHELMGSATVDILLETVMGVRKQQESKKSAQYVSAVIRMCEILHFRTYKFWLWPTASFNLSKYKEIQENLLNLIHSFTDRVIEEKKKLFKQNIKFPTKKLDINENLEKNVKLKEETRPRETETTGPFIKDDIDEDIGEKKRVAFLDLMLEAQKESELTDVEIRDEVNTIMFEGHDTTAAAASFFLTILGIHHDIQDKVYQEIRDIFGDSDRYCTHNDILEMKYLERVLLETLRLYPPVPLIAREIKRDVELASVRARIPAGATVIIPQYIIHRLAEHFGEDSEEFNPDHFLPDKITQRHPYSFIAFSAGPRSCVGRKYALMKLKVLLSTIVRNYKVYSDSTEKDFCLTADIILKRGEGFPIRLQRRKQLIKTS